MLQCFFFFADFAGAGAGSGADSGVALVDCGTLDSGTTVDCASDPGAPGVAGAEFGAVATGGGAAGGVVGARSASTISFNLTRPFWNSPPMRRSSIKPFQRPSGLVPAL